MMERSRTPAQEVARGNEAKMILDSEVFQDAIQGRRALMIATWLESEEKDSEGRERIYRMLRSADALLDDLRDVLQTGQMAQQELDFNKKLDYPR